MNNHGYTLIELMTVTGLLAIIGIGLFQSHSARHITQKNIILRQKALWILESQANRIRTSSFKDIRDLTAVNTSQVLVSTTPLPDGRVTMKVASLSQDLKRIDLTVNWRDARQQSQTLPLTLYRYRQ